MSNSKITPEDEARSQEIAEIYNQGRCDLAVVAATEFYSENPNNPLARYNYVTLQGDYSYDIRHSAEEASRLMSVAKNGISDLFHDPELPTWPVRFQRRVRNEYYWFFEKHEEQYQLGIEVIESGDDGGHYPACVGASMKALKCLETGELIGSEKWAGLSINHFKEYERFSPDWYNINYFSAQSLACLGRYEESLASYLDCYRKQKSPVKEAEVKDFEEKIASIRQLRETLGADSN